MTGSGCLAGCFIKLLPINYVFLNQRSEGYEKNVVIFRAILFLTPFSSNAADQLTTIKSPGGWPGWRSFYQHEYYFDITDDTGVGGYAKTITTTILGCIDEIQTIPVSNANCTAVNEPHDCCTGAGAGGCSEPTDNYDMTITDAYGEDISGGTLANRDTANGETIAPLRGGVYKCIQPPRDSFTVNITNNSVDEATIRLVIKTLE